MPTDERAEMATGPPHSPAQARWVQRAERVSDAFGLVLILVVVTYVLASIVSNKGWGAVGITFTTAATSVVALTSSHVRGAVVRRAILISAVAILLSVVSAIAGGRGWLNVASFLVICLLAVSMAAVLRRVVTSNEVSSRTILGAVSVYAALGILFTWAYAIVDRIEGGAFFGNVPVEGSDFLFFSYTTLTTTGYGDLVPAGQVGRMLSGLEMMLGQVFLVTLVAGLVSLWRPGQSLLRRRERREAAAGD
jgi:Ion channel